MDAEALLGTARALVKDVDNPVTNLANIAALLWEALPDINWAGFYLLDRGALRLGPFQGKPACASIAAGRGVCGAALCQDRILVVPDVHAFPGHIACDAASRSEIVAPLHHGGRAIGVLDVDSPTPGRFTQADREAMEALVSLLEAVCDFSRAGYDLTGSA